MGNYKYITNRAVKNSAGKEAGNIAVRVPITSNTADVRYKCPECSHQAAANQEWKRPFNVKCAKCGFLIRLPKLRAEIKKEKRLARQV